MPADCAVEISNEFISMRIAAYVRYVTLQMRNLVTFLSAGVLLMLLAAISYPFDQPQTIAWAITLFVACLYFLLGWYSYRWTAMQF